MKYRNKSNGVVAELIEILDIDDKYAKIHLRKEDGKDTLIAQSTFKRWWTPIQEEETIEQKSEKDANDISNAIVADFEAQEQEEASKYVEAGQKITKELNKNNSKSLEQMVEAQAEKPKKKAKAPKKTKEDTRAKQWDDIVSYLDDYAEITYRVSGCVQAVKYNGKALMEIRVKRTGGTLYVKQTVADECELHYSLVNNYYLPAVCKAESAEDFLAMIQKVVQYQEAITLGKEGE